MKIYNYNANTGEFISEGTAAENPKVKGDFLLPAYATALPPCETTEEEVAVFKDGSWIPMVDYRGKTYWIDYETSVEITELDVMLPEGATWEQPEKSEAIIKQERIAEIDTRLISNEMECLRPLRAIAAGNGTEYDTQKLSDLDTEAKALRIERLNLVSE